MTLILNRALKLFEMWNKIQLPFNTSMIVSTIIACAIIVYATHFRFWFIWYMTVESEPNRFGLNYCSSLPKFPQPLFRNAQPPPRLLPTNFARAIYESIEVQPGKISPPVPPIHSLSRKIQQNETNGFATYPRCIGVVDVHFFSPRFSLQSLDSW